MLASSIIAVVMALASTAFAGPVESRACDPVWRENCLQNYDNCMKASNNVDACFCSTSNSFGAAHPVSVSSSGYVKLFCTDLELHSAATAGSHARVVAHRSSARLSERTND